MNDFELLCGLIALSLLGTSMIILRKLKIGNEYIYDSVEWLVVGTAPLILAVSLLKDDTSKGLFIVAYVCIIVAWGVFSVLNKKIQVKKKSDEIDDEHKVRQARPWIIAMFVGMIIFVILTFLRTIGNL